MQRGFFSESELEDYVKRSNSKEPNCEKCKLDEKCNSPRIPIRGEGKKKILMVIEMPGRESDQSGELLSGRDGKILKKYLAEVGLNLTRDFWITSIIRCRSSKSNGVDLKPTTRYLKFCKPSLSKTISELNPEHIWLMGTSPIESFYMDRFSNKTIFRFVNLCIPDRDSNAWVTSFFHQSHIRRKEDNQNLVAEFRKNIKSAKADLSLKPYKHEDLEQYTKILSTFDSIENYLSSLFKKIKEHFKLVYLDYETTSLKPHWPDSKIVTISIATSPNDAVAFPFQWKDFFTPKEIRKIKGLLRKIFTHKNTGLMAHNMKFEDSWTRNIIGVTSEQWYFDTMLMAHIIDNRRKFTGLKFQSYVNFGVDPYDTKISKFLRAPSGSHINDVEKAPLKELLYYNCLDTLLGFRLYEKQQEYFTLSEGLHKKNKFPEAYNLFHNGILALSDAQENGVLTKKGYFEEKDKLLEKQIKDIKEELLSGEEAKIWTEEMPGKELKLNSGKTLGHLLYKLLGEKEVKTDKGNWKVNEETLNTIDRPFVKKLLEMRKLEKVRGTYVAQINREVCNGIIHPFYDLHIPRSFRSSSSKPNWQNIPAHHPVTGPMIREGIVPPEGWFIGEADYSSIEVKTAAILTQDPSLIKYVTDPTTDMHRDTACDIWLIPQEQVTKDIRYNSKGGWVFSQFYGSYYVNCGEDLWRSSIINPEKLADGTPLREHLHNEGIHSKTDFIEHLRGVEDIFWNQRFKVYKQWKKDINKQYRKRGYVENHFGFRFVGYMTDKETTNYPIQSTAFHILLEALTEVNRIAKHDEWQSYIIGQVHDSIILYIHPDEQNTVLQTCNTIMTEYITNKHDWITVPIDIEFELSDKSWWDKKEVSIPNGN
jgi:uracil-DNA glycosylase family 4